SAKNSQEKEKYLNIAHAENEKLIAQRNEKFNSMLENGGDIPRNSSIVVDSYYIDEENMKEKLSIRYDSSTENISEHRTVYI
ncbi:MAG: hypothetical protein IJ943_09040, partial [Akkermansia sp.]|nr:hypothetical protein [Akkermansia sp.]